MFDSLSICPEVFWPSPMEPTTPTPVSPAPEPEPGKPDTKSDHFAFRIPKAISNGLMVLAAALLLWAFSQYIAKEIRDADKDIREDLAALKGVPRQMERLERRFDDFMEAFVDKDNFKRMLKEATTGEPNKLKDTLPVAASLLKKAQAKHIVLSPAEVAELGLPVVDASFKYAVLRKEGWQTASQFADYRSYINPEVFPVSIKQGDPGPGPAYKENVFTGGTWVLDGMISTRDRFADSVIIYNGGPLHIQDVRFDRCQFQIIQNEAGARFLRALIAASGPTMSL